MKQYRFLQNTCNILQSRGHYRRLHPSDSNLISDMIHAVYGETYSYKLYYDPANLAEAIKEGKLISYGVFNEEGLIVGHTALLKKDISGEYFESGMTMRHPKRKPVAKEIEEELFRYIISCATDNAFYIHQNTTTYHPFAQRNARRYMNTKFCGFILHYASGEKIKGIDHSSHDMNSLIYTTVLSECHSTKLINLPHGQWGDWLAKILNGIGGRPSVKYVKSGATSWPISCSMIEENVSLGLVRLALCDESYSNYQFDRSREFKTLLVHLPAKEEFIQKYFSVLIENSFLPVGIRPHHKRHDEIIFQKVDISGRDVILENARLYWEEDSQFIKEWRELANNSASITA